MLLSRSSTVWTQTITELDSGRNHSVSFSIDMMGQEQSWAMVVMELYYANSFSEIARTVLEVRSMSLGVEVGGDPGFCEGWILLGGRGGGCSEPRLSGDGRHCFVDSCVMESHGKFVWDGAIVDGVRQKKNDVVNVTKSNLNETLFQQPQKNMSTTYSDYNDSQVVSSQNHAKSVPYSCLIIIIIISMYLI
jgi:hypothetical protein